MKEDLFFLGVKALIRRPDGKVLVCRLNKDIRNERNPEGWDIPGGRIKQGERIKDVLKREILEEVGITVTGEFELIVMSPTAIRLKALDREVGLIFGIYEYNIDQDATIMLGDEHEEYAWVSPADAATKLSTVFPKQLIDRLANL
jgi:8-oxo-dGTP pyrophosphatase MutT (NUDIX family)